MRQQLISDHVIANTSKTDLWQTANDNMLLVQPLSAAIASLTTKMRMARFFQPFQSPIPVIASSMLSQLKLIYKDRK